MPFYAVARGRNVGIFNTWSECETQVKGFSGAKFKKFPTRQQADEYISQKSTFAPPAVTKYSHEKKAFNIQQQACSINKLPVSSAYKRSEPYFAPKIDLKINLTNSKPNFGSSKSGGESDKSNLNILGEEYKRILDDGLDIQDLIMSHMDRIESELKVAQKRVGRIENGVSPNTPRPTKQAIMLFKALPYKSKCKKNASVNEDFSPKNISPSKPKKRTYSIINRKKTPSLKIRGSESETEISDADMPASKRTKAVRKKENESVTNRKKTPSLTIQGSESETEISDADMPASKRTKAVRKKENESVTNRKKTPSLTTLGSESESEKSNADTPFSKRTNAVKKNENESVTDRKKTPSPLTKNERSDLDGKFPKLDAKHQFLVDDEDYVHVYTDGSCFNNGTSGARAGLGVYFGEGHPLNASCPVSGRATNNCGEIQAATKAISIIRKLGLNKLCINTDSHFLINAATKWIPTWKTKNWRKASGLQVKNVIDFKNLDCEMQNMHIKWNYVNAHKGIEGNERADELAKRGAAMYKSAAKP